MNLTQFHWIVSTYMPRAQDTPRAFVPVTTAFELSKSSGQLDLIQNDSLALAIQRLYDQDYTSLQQSIEEWRESLRTDGAIPH